jgi:hypothetical protein
MHLSAQLIYQVGVLKNEISKEENSVVTSKLKWQRKSFQLAMARLNVLRSTAAVLR